MRARMVDYAQRYLPGLVPEPYAETTCLFTNTPTEDFVIDEAEVTYWGLCPDCSAEQLSRPQP